MRLIPFGPESIPIEEPSPTAPVPTTRIVTCVACDDPVPLRTADVVGLGFRCAPCSLRADIGELVGVPDVASHLSDDDRARFAASGRQLARRGFLIAGGLGAQGVLGLAIAPEASGLWIKMLLAALLVALGLGGFGLQRWRRFRAPD